MKYESLKDLPLVEIKLQNKSNYKKFEYGIDRISSGKSAQSKLFILLIIRSITFLTENFKKIKFKENNFLHKQSINKEIYSKSWWNFDF